MRALTLIFFAGMNLFPFIIHAQTHISSIKGELENIDGIATVKPLECDTFFLEKYLVTIEQPVNHKKKNSPEFTQRVVVGFKGRTRPTVFVTEGYAGNYALWPKYVNELCVLLDANLVFVEHRYFAESIPDSTTWKYHTIEQSANDHHRINQLIKNVLTGPYISTGISKGGQTTMYYKYYFPDDCEVWIPYVAPLNFSIADDRVNPFINNINGEECRKQIFDFQILALQKQDDLMDDFLELTGEKGYHYKTVGGPEAGYQMIVLEYPFAFWQWGFIPCKDIPGNDAADSTILQHLLVVSPADYFADEGIEGMWPFFYQALTQIGYYDYDTTGLGKYMDHVTDLDFSAFAPEGTKPKFRKRFMKKVNRYLTKKGNNIIFIYGEYDPWSSTGFTPDNERTNAFRIIKAGGSHTTRIRNLPQPQQTQVMDSLEKWLGVEVNRKAFQ
jgi:hypothetical protein